MDTDTFVTALYVLVDDALNPNPTSRPNKRGRPAYLTTSELVTLMLLLQWNARGSESEALRYATRHWTRFFPGLGNVQQSAFNQAARKHASLAMRVGQAAVAQLAEREGGWSHETLDCTAVPLMSRRRGERTRLFRKDEAAIGRGGSDKDWYYGVKLFIALSERGCVSGFTVAPANTADRWLAEGLFRWRRNPETGQPTEEELAGVLGPSHRRGGKRVGPTGPLWPVEGVGEQYGEAYLADLGFAGKKWEWHWKQDYGSVVLTPASAGRPADLNSRRQKVETIFGMLIDRLGLRKLRARSSSGLRARIAAKLAAFNAAVLINYLYHCPPLEFFNPTM